MTGMTQIRILFLGGELTLISATLVSLILNNGYFTFYQSGPDEFW